MIKQLVIGVVCAFLPVMGYGAETSSAENLARRVGLHGQYNAVDVITHFGDMYLDSTNHDVTKHNNHLVHYLCFGRLMDEEKDEDTFIPPVPSGQNACANPLVRKDPNQTQLSEKETILRTLLAAAYRQGGANNGNSLSSHIDTYLEKMANGAVGGNQPDYLNGHVAGVKAYITAAEKIVSDPMADVDEFQNKYKINATDVFGGIHIPVRVVTPPEEEDCLRIGGVLPPQQMTEQEIIEVIRSIYPSEPAEVKLGEFIAQPGVGGVFHGKSDDDALAIIVKTFPGLRNIDLTGTKVTDAGLNPLKNLKSLHSIDFFGGAEITGDTIKQIIRTIPTLGLINVTDCPQLTNDAVKILIRDHPKKGVYRCMDDGTLLYLQALRGDEATFPYSITNYELDVALNAQMLLESMTVQDVVSLSDYEIPRLNLLCNKKSGVHYIHMDVNLPNNNVIWQDMKEDVYLYLFCKLVPNARAIYIRGQYGLTNEGLRILTQMKNLQKLFIDQCPLITDDGLPYVKKLNLIALGLSGTSITDKGLEIISTMKNLQSLTVEDCSKITRNGFPYITALSQLTEMHFQKCTNIENEDLQALYNAHPNKNNLLWITQPNGIDLVQK